MSARKGGWDRGSVSGDSNERRSSSGQWRESDERVWGPVSVVVIECHGPLKATNESKRSQQGPRRLTPVVESRRRKKGKDIGKEIRRFFLPRD